MEHFLLVVLVYLHDWCYCHNSLDNPIDEGQFRMSSADQLQHLFQDELDSSHLVNFLLADLLPHPTNSTYALAEDTTRLPLSILPKTTHTIPFG